MGNGLDKGFTRISNDVMESVMQAGFNKREMLILLYVWRNGYGFGNEKSETKLKPELISQATGIHRNHVWETLHKLESLNVLTLINDSILFNRHAESWRATKTVAQPKQLRFTTKTVAPHNQNSCAKPSNNLTDSDLQTPKETLKEKRNPHTPKNGGLYEKLFDEIWAIYPKKKGKKPAKKSFLKIKPDDDLYQTIKTAIERQKRSQDWQKDEGRYIPHLATWLNQERWEDQLEPAAQSQTKNLTEWN